MGIVYFYTWLTTRYPLIKQKYDQKTLPIIDNLYLDINGILYKCSGSNSSIFADILKEKDVEQIYKEIINYLNYLINHIKPRKTIFIALDGVAPKAKMKDQRNRRFRKKKEEKEKTNFLENILKKKKPAQKLQSSSFSPGTKFMYELSKKIDFFIKRKIKEDQNYKKIKVIFSNANVPGEGEHKILDFLRQEKKKKNFNINETHCIYGNDSDLVLLSLVTHLPYIILLREEMEYSRIKINSGLKRENRDQNMEVIFINILREYFEIEFSGIFKGFDLERFVEDFTVFSFFIGNDFLHQVFCMNTRFGNFDKFIDVLKTFYKRYKRFVTDGIFVDWELFRKLIKRLMVLENVLIESTLKDFNFKIMDMEKNFLFQSFIKKQNGNDIEEEIKEFDLKDFKRLYLEISSGEENLSENQKSLLEIEKDIKDFKREKKSYHKNNRYKKREVKYDANIILEKPYLQVFHKNYQKLISAKKTILKILKMKREKKNYKNFYYKKYFPKNESIFNICKNYLKGIDFVIKYYIIGCPSWDFTYPYKLAPLLSDIYFYLLKLKENNIQIKFEFSKTSPTTPFKHLLHILPLENFVILPENFKKAVLENKKILELFEGDFDVWPLDQVKDYTWKASIPELEKNIFDEFLENLDWDGLSDYDKKRNGLDKIYHYEYHSDSEIIIDSMFEGFKNEIGNVFVREEEKGFDADYDLKKLDVLKIKKNIFPSVKVFEDMELKQVKFRDRFVFYFKITENSIKKWFSEIEEKFEEFNKNTPFLIFSDPIFNNSYVCNKIKKICDYKEKRKYIYDSVRYFKRMGFYLDDDYLTKMNHIYVFNIENRLHNTFSLNNDKVDLLSKSTENHKFVSFLEISLFQNYKTLKTPKISLTPDFFKNSEGINLKTGNLLKTGEIFEKTQKLLSKNLTTEKLHFSNTKEKLILLSPKLLKNDFNLKPSEKHIFFLLLDTIFIKPLQNHSSLILEGDFQVGLQFIRLIGLPFEKWRVVNEYVRVFEKKEEGADFGVFYELDDYGKKRRFNLFFSYYGYVEVCEFFKKNSVLVEFLRKEDESDNLFFFCNRIKKKKMKFIFKAKDMGLGENTNFKIFDMYYELLMKNHAYFKLGSIFAKIYSANQIATQIQKEIEKIKSLKENEKSFIKTVKKSFFLINDISTNQIFPKLKKMPKAHNLGDRVVFINTFSKKINFGQTGTIIGIYNQKVEIYFDDFFIGAENLENRVNCFRGALVDFFDVFNLSQWGDLLIEQNGDLKEFWSGDYDWRLIKDVVREYEDDVLKNKRFITDL